MASAAAKLQLVVDSLDFHAQILETENAVYRKQNAALKVENAELRARLVEKHGRA